MSIYMEAGRNKDIGVEKKNLLPSNGTNSLPSLKSNFLFGTTGIFTITPIENYEVEQSSGEPSYTCFISGSEMTFAREGKPVVSNQCCRSCL